MADSEGDCDNNGKPICQRCIDRGLGNFRSGSYDDYGDDDDDDIDEELEEIDRLVGPQAQAYAATDDGYYGNQQEQEGEDQEDGDDQNLDENGNEWDEGFDEYDDYEMRDIDPDEIVLVMNRYQTKGKWAVSTMKSRTKK